MPITIPKKRLVQGVIAAVILVVLVFLYRKYMNKSKYIVPPTIASDTVTVRQSAYSSNITACETVYITSVNNDPTTKDAATITANACITSNVTMYYNARCPFLPGTGSTPALTGTDARLTPATIGGATTSNVLYVAYKTDIDKIITAYNPLISGAGNVYSTNIIMAARKADFTGPTRRYYAALCPDLYTTTSDNSSQALYASWTTTGVSDTSAYGWDSTRVTLVKIWEWSKYARSAPTVNADNTFTAANPLLGPPALPSSSSSCTSLYSAGPTDTPNWQLASDYGPGTVISSVTLPWNTTTATCAAGTGYILNATTANPLP